MVSLPLSGVKTPAADAAAPFFWPARENTAQATIPMNEVMMAVLIFTA
jgi:hypothetical protein